MNINPIPLDELQPIGATLQRPESVIATRRGDIYVSDKRGGILWLSATGEERLIGSGRIVPNGIAMLRDRSFLAANITEEGGVWRVAGEPGNATVEPWLMEIEGRPLIGVNFVLPDSDGHYWITVTSPHIHIGHCDHTSRDGYVIRVDDNGARIVAEGLCWTNECRIHPDGKSLYVVETFGRRLARFRIEPNGDLSRRETLLEFEEGDYPDGLAFDVQGAVWVTSVISNRLIRLLPDGMRQVVLNDADPNLETFNSAYRANGLTRAMLATANGSRLRNISSLAFGGPDLKTVYLGSLGANALESFRSPVAGVAPVHWQW